ncbi:MULTISPECIES: hypothetical protein [unclassified Streptomyces]|uniref:hypothetical protein n=1 Tax=unclassified Streptomyces TaxID=2593676 RepID=UPI0036FD7D10
MPLKLMFLMLSPMNTPSGTFDAVPLEVLFPDTGVADLDRIRRSAHEIDGVQVSGKPQVWQWFPQHVTFPGRAKAGTLEILLAEVSLYDEGGDWVEVSLDVEWTEKGLLSVWSAINVACWCEADHNAHHIDPVERTVVGTTSLADAFETAADRLIQWLAGPRDPEFWRSQASLPPREQERGTCGAARKMVR